MEKREKYVVIMAAGSGSRMGGDLPKQFLELDGKAILRHTIEVFVKACPDIHIVVVLSKDYFEYWKNYCIRHSFICRQSLVEGGITRFHSVKNALKKVPDGAIVAVHDGVRPLVSVELVRRMFALAETEPALIPVVPCVDTLKVLDKVSDCKSDDGKAALETAKGEQVDRDRIFAAQTPQVFHSEILKSAYEQAYSVSFTDDASVVAEYGKNLSYIIGERFNIKITTPDDLLLAQALRNL